MAVSLQLTIRHLRAFVALAEELHFGRAAASLHLTSSALSQTLRQLEVSVGTTLVRRTPKRPLLARSGRLSHKRPSRALLLAPRFVTRGQRGPFPARGQRGPFPEPGHEVKRPSHPWAANVLGAIGDAGSWGAAPGVGPGLPHPSAALLRRDSDAE
jgi:hypothetical protein